MPELHLEIGENLWSPEGVHVLDSKGIAIKVDSPTTVVIDDQGKFDNAFNIVSSERAAKEAEELRRNPPPPPEEEIESGDT